MGERRLGPLVIAALTVLALTGCAEPMTATPVVTTSVTAMPSASASAAPGDTPTWSTASACAALSVITSTIDNADADRSAGRISKGQRAAILSTAGTSFRQVRIELRDSGPLAADIDAIVAVTPDEPTARKPGLDTSSAVWTRARQHLADTCATAGAKESELSAFGG